MGDSCAFFVSDPVDKMLELWGEAVRSIEPMLKPAHREQWIRPIQCLAIANGRIRLRAPNRYHKEWFEDNFLPSILQDLEARARQSFEVEFEIGRASCRERGEISVVGVPV